MVARRSVAELVADLAAEPTRVAALRTIKNAIIGSKAKKASYLSAGAVPHVLRLLLHDPDAGVQAQAATALGSFAYNNPAGLSCLVEDGGLLGLVGTLHSPEPRVVEAGIRALKLVYAQSSTQVPHQPVAQPSTLPCVVALLRDQQRPDVMEAAATVLARCCSSPEEQRLMTEAGVVEACLDMVFSERKPLQAAALQVLSRLLPGSAAALALAPQHRPLLFGRPLAEALVRLLRDPDAQVRLAAAACVTHLAAAVSAATATAAAPGAGAGTPASGEGAAGAAAATAEAQAEGAEGAASAAELLQQAKQAALPVLLRLLAESCMLEQVPPLLAKLLEGSEDLQKAALDADAVRHLAHLLTQPATTTTTTTATASQPTSAVPTASSSKPSVPASPAAGNGVEQAGEAGRGSCKEDAGSSAMHEGVLRALGNMCLTWNDGRRQLIEAKVLKHVVRSLEHPSDGVRAAAALCVLGLSRSISALRSTLLENEVAEVLCRLLSDRCLDVQVKVVATLCNLLLEFSSVKEAVLAQGALSAVTRLTGSTVPELRLHACCALRNLVFKSDAAVRQALMAGLPWPQFRALLNHPDGQVQEQALCTLRNLCMDSPCHIDAVLRWAGADVLACLEEKLDPSRRAPRGVALHALYTVVNLLTGSESHKDAVMASNLPALLTHYLRCPSGSDCGSPELRVSAIWCVINLTWPEDGPGGAAACAARGAKLRELGVEELLRALMDDRDMDVKERARTAWEQLTSRGAQC